MILLQTPDGNISTYMRHLNSVYTQRYNRRHGFDGQLFRGRYKSILVCNDSHLLQLVRYIHKNPVKAGVIKDIPDYEWSSYKGYLSYAKKWEWSHKDYIYSMITPKKRGRLKLFIEFMHKDDSEEVIKLFSFFDSTLKPFGILDVLTGLLTIVFGNSSETSDFIVDALLIWWHANKHLYPHIKELVINLDNGPQNSSHRTQFIKRITEFADETGLRIHIVYYPPYHSKYNPIERCWGALEQHWNGTILDSVEKTIKWAGTMTWKGIKPAIKLIDKVYQKGVSLTKEEMKKYAGRLKRSKLLAKWDIMIDPILG